MVLYQSKAVPSSIPKLSFSSPTRGSTVSRRATASAYDELPTHAKSLLMTKRQLTKASIIPLEGNQSVKIRANLWASGPYAKSPMSTRRLCHFLLLMVLPLLTRERHLCGNEAEFLALRRGNAPFKSHCLQMGSHKSNRSSSFMVKASASVSARDSDMIDELQFNFKRMHGATKRLWMHRASPVEAIL